MFPSPWYQPFQQRKSKADDTKYEPSKPLRYLIYERLSEERDLLLKLVEKTIAPMIVAAERGNQTSQDRFQQKLPPTPGDQQISAQAAKQVTEGPSGWAGASYAEGSRNYGRGSFARPYSGLGGQYAPPENGYPIERMTPWAMLPTPFMNKPEKKKAKDPVERYLQLEAEIDALMTLSESDSGTDGRHWMGMMANGYAAADNPRKARTKQLMRVLDAPQPVSDDDGEEEEEEEEKEAAPAAMQQGPAPYPQPLPNDPMQYGQAPYPQPQQMLNGGGFAPGMPPPNPAMGGGG